MLQNADFEMLMKSRTFREVFDAGIARGKQEGIEAGKQEVIEAGKKEGIEKGRRAVIEEVLHGLLKRRMQRELTPDEQAALSSRAATLDGEQASAVVDLDADALRDWLFESDAA